MIRLHHFFALLFLIQIASQIDICEVLDANYCFYFSDSSCYINLCQCEACSTKDSAAAILEFDNSTSSIEKLCPSWCSHVKSNETILNILGKKTNSSSSPHQQISFECGDLLKNCLTTKGYNGHCYFYEKNCDYREEVALRGKTKHGQVQFKKCLKFQKKCHEKNAGHYSCKMLRRKCRGIKLPELNSTINSTLLHHSESTSPLEQCINYQKICATKYSKHFACKQFNKKCKKYSLPPIEKKSILINNEVRKNGREHNRNHHHHHHHHPKTSNETLFVDKNLMIGNETLIEKFLML